MTVFVIRNKVTGMIVCDDKGNFKIFYRMKNARKHRRRYGLNYSAYEIMRVKSEELR